MKFRVDRDVLAEAVAWAARSLPSRPSAPVLAGLLLEAGPDALVLSSFDYETSARVTVPAEVSDEGTALVSGKLLADICRSLPHQPVEAAADTQKLSLTCGSARFSLQLLPVEDYPTLPQMPATTGTVGGEQFAAAVAQAVTAAGRDDMLPVLTGVRIEIEGQTMALLATDRFRLGLRELQWQPTSPDMTAEALVPAKVLADTAKTLSGADQVTVALAGTDSGEGLVGFEGTVAGSTRRTTTRLIDGKFPPVRSLFPDQHTTTARVDRASLVDSVRRVALVAERNTAVQMAFSADGVLTLDAGSGDEAQASEAVETQLAGEDIATGFNPQFLLDGLQALGAEVVQLGFTQASKPVVITGAGSFEEEPETDFRYLLMPRRLLA